MTSTSIHSSVSTDDDLSLDIKFRTATSHDIPVCFDIEINSYPSDEAASKESLYYRQKEASPYFRCAVNSDNNNVIGFICSTRCNEFTEESMSTHLHEGKLLAIHSVVIQNEYRRNGLGATMLTDYIKAIQNEKNSGIEKIVLLAKSHLLGFYVNCGFTVTKPSAIVHGSEQWYDLEMNMNKVRPAPNADESWFVKTEQFIKPFPIVKPHLEAHKEWVDKLRSEGYCITSGYRVDSEGKPGGGGLMFLAASSYEDAEELVRQDPLVHNECVDWKLNGWVGEVGNIELR